MDDNLNKEGRENAENARPIGPPGDNVDIKEHVDMKVGPEGSGEKETITKENVGSLDDVLGGGESKPAGPSGEDAPPIKGDQKPAGADDDAPGKTEEEPTKDEVEKEAPIFELPEGLTRYTTLEYIAGLNVDELEDPASVLVALAKKSKTLL